MMKNFKWMITLLFGIGFCLNTIGQQALTQPTAASQSEGLKAWDKLIGEWDVVWELTGHSGVLQSQSYGTWKMYYVLDGAAIQHEYKITTSSGKPFQFIGLGTYDKSTNTYKLVTVDNIEQKHEFAEGISSADGFIFNKTQDDGNEFRMTFYDITEDSFIWKQEKLDKHTGTWSSRVRTVAKRKK